LIFGEKSHHLIYTINNNYSILIDVGNEYGNEKICAAVLKNHAFCGAELKDFEYDASFTIVGAIVYFSGQTFGTWKMEP
jgi:hypothetical protein